MAFEKKQYCPNCRELVSRKDDSCIDCGFQLVDEDQKHLEIKKKEQQIVVYKSNFQLNLPANLSLIFTVIAAILYAIPWPAISLYGGVPFSVLAVITGSIGLFNPNLRTRKIWAFIIAFVAPAVWVIQFMFFGINYL
ncbi:MAG: hypothetical protein KGD59_01020 [Candidatus Heimdallarchaeota archaeon]|nr:hypothetical protein [Candidatus Heimdallarchaeota archaeon]MBY8993100.1 hypothetical protein [Candidatus Heimdallarchaeota archaeon]